MFEEEKCPKSSSLKQDCPPRPCCLPSQTSKFRKCMGVGIFRVIDHRHDIALVAKTDLKLFALQDMVRRLGLNIID